MHWLMLSSEKRPIKYLYPHLFDKNVRVQEVYNGNTKSNSPKEDPPSFLYNFPLWWEAGAIFSGFTPLSNSLDTPSEEKHYNIPASNTGNPIIYNYLRNNLFWMAQC